MIYIQLPINCFLSYNTVVMIEELQTFFLAMVPLLELRAALPVALVVYQMSPISAYLWSVLGNIIPIFLILSLFDPVSVFLSKKSVLLKRFFSFLTNKARNDYTEKLEKYGYLALALFTSIPLPITGAWTASLVVIVFGMKKGLSILSIIIGVLLAGVGVMLITISGVGVESYYGPQVLLGIVFLIFLIYFIIRKRKTK